MATATAENANSTLLLLLSLSPMSRVIIKGKKRAPPPDGAFQCRTCGRRFTTFQELGGHRTSHKRPLVHADGLDLLLGASPGAKGAAAKDVHRCNTCGTVFPTGQALGGHMRRHRAAIFHVPALETMRVGLSEDLDGEDDDDHLRSSLIKFI